MGKEKVIFSKLGFAYAIFFIVSTLSQIAWMVLIRWTGWAQSKPDLTALLTMLVPMYLCAFPVLLLLCRKIPARHPASKTVFHWGIWLGIVVICIGITFWCNLLGQGFMKLFDTVLNRTSNNDIQDLIMELHPLVLFIAAVIFAPVMEELMFRKLLIDRLHDYGDEVVIVLSGLMFGFAHGNFFQFFYAFALGMIFAYIYIKTGKIGYCILLHMMINFMGSMVPLFLMRLSETDFSMISVLLIGSYAIGMICFMAASLVLLGYFFPRLSLQEGVVQIPRDHKMQIIMMNPGMLLFVLVGSLLFFV